jgi:hypothetical protein
MDEVGEITIKVEGTDVSFSTNLSIFATNFFLDYVKYLLVSGEAQEKEE